MGDDGVEVLVGLGERRTFRGDIAVVETIKRCADFLEKLKGCIHANLGDGHGIFALFPRPYNRAWAKRIRAGAAECVPIGDGETQVLRHGLTVHDLGGIVVAEGEGIGAAGAFVGDRLDGRKVRSRFFHKLKVTILNVV